MTVLVGGYFLLAGKKTANAPEDLPAGRQGAPIDEEVAKIPTHVASIQNFSFDPLSSTVKKGDTIVWTNKDSAPHTVTWDVGGQQSSGTLKTGESFSFTVNTTGTFSYHCAFHPSMKGKVIVE